MAKARCGPSIREFLTYHVLMLLAAKRRTMLELVEEIEARSAENRSVRSNGALRVNSREMEGTVYSLADRGWVRLRPPGASWGITRAGRRARREMGRASRGTSDSKERAASKLLARLKEAPKGSYVLDVGTGEGFLARRLAKRGFRVLGIDSGAFDYSKHSIEKARRGVGSDNGRLEFRKADVTRLRRPPGGFDFVVASQAVHCMKNQRKCLRAIHRLLKPGGRFLCLDFLVGLEGFLAHGFHCFLAISREEWSQMLPAIGFDDIYTQKVRDYLIVDASKAHGHPEPSHAAAKDAETACGRKRDQCRRDGECRSTSMSVQDVGSDSKGWFR
ncbi:MAG: methyltransferase domain-containing protein [Armatimonadota bacterium]|nr:MAG: methyltransferase domain-containing protein [Armatimonadota bacterium]